MEKRSVPCTGDYDYSDESKALAHDQEIYLFEGRFGLGYGFTRWAEKDMIRAFEYAFDRGWERAKEEA